MPYLIGDHLAMHHIPKTAGIWAREACAAAGMPWSRCGTDQHNDRPLPKDREVFMMVRHPVDWLRSFWMYHQQHKWQHYSDAPPFVFYACHRDGEDFETFVKRYLEKMPGAIGRMFERYRETSNLVVHVEDLPHALVGGLRLLGVEFDDSPFYRQRPLNVSSEEMRQRAYMPAWLHLDVVEAEEKLINEWYGGRNE